MIYFKLLPILKITIMTITNIYFNKSKLSTEDRPEIIINNTTYPISVPESKILQLLIENNNKSVDKNTLIIAAWEHPDFIGPNSLAVAVSNLRKILNNDDIKITNTPRIGYKISYDKIKKTSINEDNGIDVAKIIINSDINHKLKILFSSSPIQLTISLLLAYFILNIIQSWVII